MALTLQTAEPVDPAVLIYLLIERRLGHHPPLCLGVSGGGSGPGGGGNALLAAVAVLLHLDRGGTGGPGHDCCAARGRGGTVVV